ncbi:GerAB/ArcD/ProY family transporter [Cohnella candidum]|uniref:Spore gernimation protein n=1 Tax=Cohnella candidum TaxID=2674991 RepID=A0A3G3JVP6_9BACL|nr:endospore germination permease [Cohnella candidum]AYQ72318.1 spore gernimation protein [Cohnella candidum]
MQSKQDAIGLIPVFSVIILAIGLMNHVMVLPPLLKEAGRDAWISVLSVIVPYLAWTAILFGIMRITNQQPIVAWLRARYGRAAGWTLRIVFILYLFVMCSLTLKDTVLWTQSSYLPRTPRIALSLSLMFLCGMAVHYGLRAIAVTSGILLPFVIVFGDFVMSANLPVKQYSLLSPILVRGWDPVLRGGLYIGGGLSELIVLLLIQHRLKKKVRLWSICVLALFLILLIFGPVTGAIAEFGPAEAAMLRYPAYEEWRLVRIGKYIRHVDFLSIYQWLSGAFVRISFTVYLLLDLLTFRQASKKGNLLWLAALCALTVILVELPISDMRYLAFLKHVYLPCSLWGATAVLAVLFVLAWIRKPLEKESYEN